ncbi:hypothetical protein [Asticcacaulis machinosus]|uniref:Transposase n=1 Tax=Asticcacaulis machinosus TaxID=2984211 RepID=A0ABT5HEF8_9CAUL|nr:hypothetical protein [Asticcacaulis machinosus]MDC7674646.1 hypothetical protein [Asticcacaulis machinosus]
MSFSDGLWQYLVHTAPALLKNPDAPALKQRQVNTSQAGPHVGGTPKNGELKRL